MMKAIGRINLKYVGIRSVTLNELLSIRPIFKKFCKVIIPKVYIPQLCISYFIDVCFKIANL